MTGVRDTYMYPEIFQNRQNALYERVSEAFYMKLDI